MMEERYHATTQNRFYPDMSNVNKNITVEAKLISPPTYLVSRNVTITIISYGNGTEKETIKLLTFWIDRALNRSCSSRPAY